MLSRDAWRPWTVAMFVALGGGGAWSQDAYARGGAGGIASYGETSGE
eukprot:gene57480-78758_t